MLKLLAVSKQPYPVFALKRLKKHIKRTCWALQNMWPLLYVSVASQVKARFLNLGCKHPQVVLKSISGGAGEGHICRGQR